MDYRGPLTYCGQCNCVEYMTVGREAPSATDILRSSIPRVVKEDCEKCCRVEVSNQKIPCNQRLVVTGPGKGAVGTLDRAKDKALVNSCSGRLREQLTSVGWLKTSKGPTQKRNREELINQIREIIKTTISGCEYKAASTACPSLQIAPCKRRFIISERVATTKTSLYCCTCNYFVCYVCGEKEDVCSKAGVCPEFLTDHSALSTDIPQCVTTFHHLRLVRHLVAARLSLGTEIFDIVVKYFPTLLSDCGVELSEIISYEESPPAATHRTDSTIKYRLP
eukprot:TRINITY_DN15773_c0_g1_i1.p1 TRINITY_DN15773_c0_g1~~TRINITY_DN15773_c0_g1_i1.p1  ORF type:complete len:279 (+),score=28.11 TRINITY_DN15773_c0_g1_i1:67-903(+)